MSSLSDELWPRCSVGFDGAYLDGLVYMELVSGETADPPVSDLPVLDGEVLRVEYEDEAGPAPAMPQTLGRLTIGGRRVDRYLLPDNGGTFEVDDDGRSWWMPPEQQQR